MGIGQHAAGAAGDLIMTRQLDDGRRQCHGFRCPDGRGDGAHIRRRRHRSVDNRCSRTGQLGQHDAAQDLGIGHGQEPRQGNRPLVPARTISVITRGWFNRAMSMIISAISGLYLSGDAACTTAGITALFFQVVHAPQAMAAISTESRAACRKLLPAQKALSHKVRLASIMSR